MSNTTKAIMEMVEILPEQDQYLAYEIIKKMVLAWDPDFTKLTPNEADAVKRGEEEIKNGYFALRHSCRKRKYPFLH